MSAQQIQSLSIERLPLDRQVVRALLPTSADERANAMNLALFRATFERPHMVGRFIPGALIALLPEHDPEVGELNLEAARRARRAGQAVHFLLADVTGTPSEASALEFTIELRDDVWGYASRAELSGRTAAELRTLFRHFVAMSQHARPLRLRYENVVMLNGVRIYIVDEPEPGVYDCVAFGGE